MSEFATALAVEARKAVASWTLRTTGLLLTIGLPVVVGTVLWALRGGGAPDARAQLLAKLGPGFATADWHALVLASTQVMAAASMLAFGVGASWLVGREFGEGTVPALFGLPVSRSAIAAAKLVVHLCWSGAVSVVLVLALTVLGLAAGLGVPSIDATAGLARVAVLGMLTGLITIAAAVAATLGRGVLPGVAVAVVTIVLAQVSVLTGSSAWIPLSAPALWATNPEVVPVGSLALVVAFGALCSMLVLEAWRRLQLAR